MRFRGSTRRDLLDLIGDETRIGVSLVLTGDPMRIQQGKLLFALRLPSMEGDSCIWEATGIGGKVDPADDSLTAALLREAVEETGCHARLVDAESTLVIRGPQAIAEVVLTGSPRPLAVVHCCHGTSAHQPWSPSPVGRVCVVVYGGHLDGRPEPRSELGGLLWLDPRWVVEMARRDVELGELLSNGAMTVVRPGLTVTHACRVRLTDSQEALVSTLGCRAIAFYTAALERQITPGL